MSSRFQVSFVESGYSTTRRSVVVSAPTRKEFVYACGISTYSGRATLKNGCSPEDHAMVYFSGTSPVCSLHERQRGLPADAIEVCPAESGMTMNSESRINFGKTVAIERNIKVKDIGQVVSEDMSVLVSFWKAANFGDDN
ncbi:hypothetical protein C7974DRAFT_15550 [Boeremia exigua]|uniref:uncharacterized protein n=1 Tax=Boeremia exigua TaxID=749465 RepID=UPI001E8D47E9|nr:uncharacterized protein C7974DRAFT_15550 [Boeremia exigua]KAH6644147.1 hypothetical protein C7974DRAFT_15550 [Boeremia exigua]